MKNIPVVITGLGVITSNSQNVSEFFDNCLAGQVGMKKSTCPVFDTKNLRTDYWGQIENRDELSAEATQNFVYRSYALAKHSIDEALEDCGLSKSYLSSLGNRGAVTIGSLSYDDYHILESLRAVVEAKGEELPYLKRLSEIAVCIKKYCGIQGGCYNFSAACASGTTAIGAAMELISSGQSDVVVVCGVDALSKIIAYGFHSLKALSTGLCHPLDENRDGINIGEGCGVLILESKEHAKRRHAEIYAECISYSLGNEAFHITSPVEDGSGFLYSMQNALKKAEILPQQLDYINLHGTGTSINDAAEIRAVSKLYENTERKPYISSLKTLIGHCMGAAGTLEAILTVMGLKHQRYLPVFGTNNPIKGVEEYSETHMPMKYALSNSFGFAGNTSSVVFASEGTSVSRKKECKKHPVYINGIGILIPGISNVEDLNEKLGFVTRPIENKEEIVSQIVATPTTGIPAKKLRGVNHLSRMVLSTALQVEKDAALDHALWKPEEVGTVYSSAYGALNERFEFGKVILKETPDLCSPTVFSNISPNAPLGYLCMNMNCKGVSTSMHGASPLPFSKIFVENGLCNSLFSLVAEEYNELIAKEFSKEDSLYKLPYQESCIELFLQNEKSESSYCTIGEVSTYSLDGDPLIDRVLQSEEEKEAFAECLTEWHEQLEKRPDAVFVMGLDTPFEKVERELLEQQFTDCPILTVSKILGGLQHNSFYANIAAASICLKKGETAKSLFDEKAVVKEVSTILVTGYDACGNYHNVMLYK